ncbi:MAG: hypothetical protein LBK22_04980, partial [Tannerella sp.]|nr:hypothetical protein [Tannerella sp.]
VSRASVSLPGAFRKPGSGSNNERIVLALQQVLFDENGFTGNVSVSNLIPGETLNPEQWGISVNDFALAVMKNQVAGFGFGGEVNIPPFGSRSRIPYTASYNHATETCEFQAGIQGKYDFPVLKSSITLNELSSIDLVFKESDVYPSIHASGELNISAPLGSDSTQAFTVPGIAFENMVISRESPYFEVGAIGVTGSLHSPKIAGFELSIEDIRPFRDSRGSGLAFTAGVSLSDMFGGKAGMQLYGDYQKWKFREVAVDRVNVEYRSGAFSLYGGVWLKNGDEVYGNGFRGDLRLDLLEKFSLDAVGVFGRKDGYRYFLTDVFLEVPPPGIIVPPTLAFYGFGGGLYRRMQQAKKLSQSPESPDSDFGRSLSGISYVPDDRVSLGFMASTKFGLAASPSIFNAKVGFEMQFNSHGGLNFVQFRGEASFMDLASKLGSLSDNINKAMDRLESSSVKQPEKTKRSDIDKAPDNKGSGFLTASLNVEYDLINRTFSADMAAYLNAGVIRGIGPGDRLGWASFHSSPDEWYIYAGTPEDRLGVEVLSLARLSGYFMTGSRIPPLPPPPSKVLNLLSADKRNRLSRSKSDAVSIGKGIAFGAAFEMNFDARLTPFYAHFGLGLGAEFALTDLKGRTCANYSGTPGINGWYAQAQAWAYVDAGIGMEARVFGKRRKFEILDLSVGTLLEGAGPNPVYFAGAVGGRYSVLGGLVKGNCSFDFEIGEKCILTGGSPFGEDVIEQLSPGSGERDVNVFAAPQVVFNIPVEKEMIISDDESGHRGTYKATLEEVTLKYKDTGVSVTGRPRFSSDGRVYMLALDEPFESQREVTAYAKVSFQKKIDGRWQYVTGDDGRPVFEDKTSTFHTGDRPKEIQPEHVKYTYPIDRQYNFYPEEYRQGYILVSQNYTYLFTTEKPEGFRQAMKITDISGKSTEKPFTFRTSSAGNDIRLEIDFSMDGISFDSNRIYRLSISNIPEKANASMTGNISSVTTAVEGQADMSITKQQATETLTQLEEKEICALHFRSSSYGTVAEKMKAFEKPSEGWRDYIEPYVHFIKMNLREPELFDRYETQGAAGYQPVIRFEAQMDRTDWFTGSFYRDMYPSLNPSKLEQNRKIFDAGRDYGSPPAGAVSIVTGDDDRHLSDDEISVGMLSGYGAGGVFRYSLSYWCARDFFYAKRDIAERIYRNESVTQREIDLLNRDFPPTVAKGDYPVKVSYVLPGRDITTSTTELVMYNPVRP